jgi:hypothetical protein
MHVRVYFELRTGAAASSAAQQPYHVGVGLAQHPGECGPELGNVIVGLAQLVLGSGFVSLSLRQNSTA